MTDISKILTTLRISNMYRNSTFVSAPEAKKKMYLSVDERNEQKKTD